MTGRSWSRALVTAYAAAALLGALPATASAEGAGCESTDSLAVNYLPDDGVQIVRNDCALPVRAISYGRYTTNVPLTGFPSEPGKYNKWTCADPATGPAETTSNERNGNWLITYAKGWQVRRGDGRWHTVDHVYTVNDHAAVGSKPLANDTCTLSPTDDDISDEFDDGFVPY